MMQLVEDIQALSPGVPGRLLIAVGELRVSEVLENFGLAGTITKIAEQSNRLPVVFDGFRKLTLLVMDIPEAVQCCGFAALIAELAEQLKCLPAMVDSLRRGAGLGAQPAYGVESTSLAVSVACLVVEGQCELFMLQCKVRAILLIKHEGDGLVTTGDPDAVTGLLEQFHGLGKVAMGIPVFSEPCACLTEGAVRVRLSGDLPGAPGCGQGCALTTIPIPPVPAALQEVTQRPGKLPRMGVKPVVSGELHATEESVVLGVEPGHRPWQVSGPLGDHHRIERNQRYLTTARMKQSVGGTGRMQVVTQHPADGGPPLCGLLRLAGLLGCVGAYQVMEGVPARRVLSQQIGLGQSVERTMGRRGM